MIWNCAGVRPVYLFDKLVKAKLVRITTVPGSLKVLLRGQLRFMSENGFEVIGVSSNGRELEDVEMEEDIRTISIEMTRKISPLRDLWSVWKLYWILRKEAPVIVHTHTPKAGVVGMVAGALAGVPLRLHTVAGLPLLEARGFKRQLLDLVEKVTYMCAYKVYPNSKGLFEIILANGYTRVSKLRIIANGSSNGIDTSFFHPNSVGESQRRELKRFLGIEDKSFIFIFIGRQVADKGVNELVEVFCEIRKSENSHADPKLLLVGTEEPNLDPLLPETIKKMELNPNIIRVGYQNDVRPYLSISHALVFPSYREGFPNVVMQAGAMSLPSIVTNINGCNEIIVDGKNGTIIPPKNKNALHRAMLQIMNDSEYYSVLKRHARPMIKTRYEQKIIWRELLAEYRELLRDNLDR